MTPLTTGFVSWLDVVDGSGLNLCVESLSRTHEATARLSPSAHVTRIRDYY